LTREGELFHERCKDLLSGVGDAEAEVTRHAGELIGELRVSAPVTFGLMHLAPLWPAFMARHPRWMLDVTLGDRVVDLVDEGCDLAVRIAQLPSSSLVSRKLAATRLILCATPSYLRIHGVPSHPSELTHHSVFAYKLLSTGEQWHFEGPEGPVAVKVNPRMRSNRGDTCSAAAPQHQGVVLPSPSWWVRTDLGCLGRGAASVPVDRAGVDAVYPSRKQLAPEVRMLVDFLVEAVRGRAWPD
jgi:DNA-binding transcriptional LysR family regulator